MIRPPLPSQSLPIDVPLDVEDGGRKLIGLILLSTDLTLERLIPRLIPIDDVTIFVNRVTYHNPMTVENLAAVETNLTQAARDILPGVRLDAIAFACTSGTIAIGPDQVMGRLADGQPGVPATTPITAAIDGMNQLGLGRLALLTPYRDAVNQPIADFIEGSGVKITKMSTFDMDSDIDVGRIPVPTIIEAAIAADDPDAEALFLSCTALQAADCIPELEDKLGKPVLTSNQALLWRAMRLAGYDRKIQGYGELLTL